ncbi:4-hydroxybenzoate polyprenyltransferase [Alteromonadaceae bacterium 2753L.S.0a.02]|nr:4-hydroxybenzoate polyprenyltransferase [Alteromonadaceae bacterium 2753L.S.0a.02]
MNKNNDTSFMKRGLGLLAILRPKQWIKNLFVLSPLVFSGNLTNTSAIVDAVIATVFFCIASSAVYIINDYHDIEKDRLHPVKSKTRPLASGAVSKPAAIILFVILVAFLFVGGYILSAALPIIIVYFFINLLYTFYLKHKPVIDIFTIATGFVLRVYAGAMGINVEVSTWMFVTTLCLALFLASVKRKKELTGSGSAGRKVLDKYSVELVDKYAQMSSMGALVFYSLFVLSERSELAATIPFVIYGLYRYWYSVDQLDMGESPTDALYSDWQLGMTVVLWAASCAYIIVTAS